MNFQLRLTMALVLIGPGLAYGQSSCPNDLSYLAERVRTPELRVEVRQTVEDGIREAGSLDRAIILTRAQITKYEELLEQVTGDPNYRTNPDYDRYVAMVNDGIMVNSAYLDALECRRTGNVSAGTSARSREQRAAREVQQRQRERARIRQCEQRKQNRYRQCRDAAQTELQSCWNQNRSPLQIGVPSQCSARAQTAQSRCESIQYEICN